MSDNSVSEPCPDTIRAAVAEACSVLDCFGGLNSYRAFLSLTALRRAITSIGRGSEEDDDDSESESSSRNLLACLLETRSDSSPTAWNRLLIGGLSQIADMRVPQVTCHCAADVFFLIEGVVAEVVNDLVQSPTSTTAALDNVKMINDVAALLTGFIRATQSTAIPDGGGGASKVKDATRHPLLDDDDEEDTPLSLLVGLLTDYSEGVLLGCFALVAAVTQSVYAVSALCEEAKGHCTHQDDDKDIGAAFEKLHSCCEDVVSQLYASSVMSQVVTILARRTEGIAAKSSFTPNAPGGDQTQSSTTNDQETEEDTVQRIKRINGPSALSGFKLCPEPGQSMEGDDELANDAGVVLVQPPMASTLSTSSQPSGLSASTGSLMLGGSSRPPSTGRPTSSLYRSVSGRISSAFHNQRRALVASFGESSAQIIALGLQVVSWHYQRLVHASSDASSPSSPKTPSNDVLPAPDLRDPFGAVAASPAIATPSTLPRLQRLKGTLVLLLRHCVGVQAATTKSQLGGLGSGPGRVGVDVPTALSFTAKLAVPVARTIHHMLINSGSGPTDPNDAQWRTSLLSETILPAINRYCMLLLMLGRVGDASERRHQVLLLTNTVDALCKLGAEVVHQQRGLWSTGPSVCGEEHARILYRLFNVPFTPSDTASAPKAPMADVLEASDVPLPGGDSPARCGSPIPHSIMMRPGGGSHPGSGGTVRYGAGSASFLGVSSAPPANESLHFIPSLLSLRGSFLHQGSGEGSRPSTGSTLVDIALLHVSAVVWGDLVSGLLGSGLHFTPLDMEPVLEGALKEAVEDALDVAAECTSVDASDDMLGSYAVHVRNAITRVQDVVLQSNSGVVYERVGKAFITSTLGFCFNFFGTATTRMVEGVKSPCINASPAQRKDAVFIEEVANAYHHTCSGPILEVIGWLRGRVVAIRNLPSNAGGDSTSADLTVCVSEDILWYGFQQSTYDLTSVFYLVFDLCEVQLSDLLDLGEDGDMEPEVEEAVSRLDEALTPVQRQAAEGLFQLMLQMNTPSLASLVSVVLTTFSSQQLLSGRGLMGSAGGRHRSASDGGRHRGGSRSGSARRLRTITPTQLLDSGRRTASTGSARGRVGAHPSERPKVSLWPALQDADDAHDLMVAVIPIINGLLQLSTDINVSANNLPDPTINTPVESTASTYWYNLLSSLLYVLRASEDYPMRIVTLYTLHNALVAMTSKAHTFQPLSPGTAASTPKGSTAGDGEGAGEESPICPVRGVLRLPANVRPFRPSGRGGDNPRATSGFPRSPETRPLERGSYGFAELEKFSGDAHVSRQLANITVDAVTNIVSNSVWGGQSGPTLPGKGNVRGLVHSLRRSEDDSTKSISSPSSQASLIIGSGRGRGSGIVSAVWSVLGDLAATSLNVLVPSTTTNEASSPLKTEGEGSAALDGEGAMELVVACCMVAEQLLMLGGRGVDVLSDPHQEVSPLATIPSPFIIIVIRFVSQECLSMQEEGSSANSKDNNAAATTIPPPSHMMQLLLLWLQFDSVREAIGTTSHNSLPSNIRDGMEDVLTEMASATASSPNPGGGDGEVPPRRVFANYLSLLERFTTSITGNGSGRGNANVEAWRYVGCQVSKYRQEVDREN